MEMVKQIAFETSLKLGEQEGGIEPKQLALLSSAIQRLEQAESLSFKREQAIRKEVAQQAAETAEKWWCKRVYPLKPSVRLKSKF